MCNPQMLMKMALRKCKDCGVEANTEEELQVFLNDRTMKYGKSNLCKKCKNKRVREKLKDNDVVYLKGKFYDMKTRCYNPMSQAYHYYGGRGITIYQGWLDNSDSFIEWSLTNGFKRGLWIDRVDNDGPYSPENCQWVTASENLRNTRNNVTDFESGTRICRICKVEKPLTEFNKSKREAMEKAYICTDCSTKLQRERRTRVKARS